MATRHFKPTNREACWVLALGACHISPDCDRCSVLRKALEAATWVRRNWTAIQTNDMPRAK